MSEFFKSVKDYWFIAAFVGTIIVGWTQFDARISALERNDESQDTKIEAIVTDLRNISTGQTEIKTTVDFIKNYITK